MADQHALEANTLITTYPVPGSSAEGDVPTEDALDEALEESFPASDPPASSNFD